MSAPRFDSWSSYLYPPPHHNTLVNLLGERDPVKLTQLEYTRTAVREAGIITGQVDIPRTYDLSHLQAIHRHLFQDVYAWAGELRSVDMIKSGGRMFAGAATGEIQRYAATARRIIERTDWNSLDRDAFAHAAADVFANVNQAHPFREGNGRTSKVFLQQVAELSQFSLDYSKVTPNDWNLASRLSQPRPVEIDVRPTPLVSVFVGIAMERTDRPPTSHQPDSGSLVAAIVRLRSSARRFGQHLRGRANGPDPSAVAESRALRDSAARLAEPPTAPIPTRSAQTPDQAQAADRQPVDYDSGPSR